MFEIVWSLMGEWKYPLIIVGLSFVGVFAFIQIWKIQLEKAYVRYTEMIYNHALSMKKAEKLFMQVFFEKDKGSKAEQDVVKKELRKAIKEGRLVKVEYTYEGEWSVRYLAHNEEALAFRALMIKQAKWIKALKWLRPFNINKFTLHDIEFKKAIGQ